MRYLTLVLVTLFSVLSCSRDAGNLYVPLKEEQKTEDPNAAGVVKNDTYQLKSLTTNPIDIIWVVDNSGSMDDDIYNMKINMHLFMAEFEKIQGADWKMGLMSAGTGNNTFLGFHSLFDYKDATPASTFNSALDKLVKTTTLSNEMTCKPLMQQLYSFPNFLRKDAMLALIMVTDEDEQSYHGECNQLVTNLTNLKGNLNKMLIYGVFGARDMSCQHSGDFTYKNSYYEKFVNSFPTKKLFSLCSPNFGKDMTAIANDIVAHFERRRVVLPELAIPETVQVFYQGKELVGGLQGYWVYFPEPNAVYFNNLDFASGDNEKVQVRYKVRPKPSPTP